MLANEKHCTGCCACVDSCSQNALSVYTAEDGHLYVTVDEAKCISCHKCEKICPVTNGIGYSSNVVKGAQPYSVVSTNEDLYAKSTSGGAFAAIATQFIKGGGYVCGAVFEANTVKHIVSNNLDDISRMQGSKYLQSSLEGVYKEISFLLKQGKKVLFCGMGCQGAAMYSYFSNNKNRSLLYIVDMICGGVPSSFLLKKYLENEKRFKQVVGFRKKGRYTLLCQNQKNEIEDLSYCNLPLMGFFSGLTNRYSCGDCRFCGVERLSDITIGDFWEAAKTAKKQKSVAIVHTSKGDELLHNTQDIIIKTTDWNFIRNNYRCVVGKTMNNYRLQRRLLAWNFKHLSYKTLCGIYGCSTKNPIFIMLKAYNYFYRNMVKVYIKIRLNNIMKTLSNKKS